MKKTVSIIQALTEHYYHAVPSKLEMITLSPEREAIFDFLAYFGSDKFPEFIKDILIQVEKHRLIDITDGTGDEKQDILTLTSSGERHITQCKHTINYKENYSGDDLDHLFSACFRKNCSKGLFVTNSDLTTPGKRYVTDKEYARGWKGPKEHLPEMYYWNAEHIWNRISTNNGILNKWFSGMSQAHGLRRFSFNLMIQHLPTGESNIIKCKDIIPIVKTKEVIQHLEGDSYKIKLDACISFSMCDYYVSDIDMGVPYIGPETEHPHANIPLNAIRIQCEVSDAVGQFDPAHCRDLIVNYIGNLLPDLPKDEWWYLVSTTPQAFVFLHDISEPKVISISRAETYVRIENQPVSAENRWLFPQGEDYLRDSKDGDKQLLWFHKDSDTDVCILLEQRPHPIDAHNHYIRQLQLIEELVNYEFWLIKNASNEIMDVVRHIIVDPKWMIMAATNREIYIAFPPDLDKSEINVIEDKLRACYISVQHLNHKERRKIMKSIEKHPENSKWYFNCYEDNITTPVWFEKRILWLSKEISGYTPKDIDALIDIVKYKATYENRYGYDFMHGKKESSMSQGELRGFLYDLMSVRGQRMLDVVFNDAGISVNLRIREKTLQSTTSILPQYISDLESICGDIVNLIAKFNTK
jgi:hypothetical protein